MAIAYSTANVSGTADSGATTQQSSSTVVPSGAVVWVLVENSDGSPSAPTSVVWDPTGVNETLTQVGTTITHGTYARASLWRSGSLTAKTGVFKATWSSVQGERMVNPYVLTGANTSSPNGTITQVTGGAGTAISSGAITVTSGQWVACLVGHLDLSHNEVAYNAPSHTERVEGLTLPDEYDGAAMQDTVASGTSVTFTWTASSDLESWGMFVIPVNAPGSGGTDVVSGSAVSGVTGTSRPGISVVI